MKRVSFPGRGAKKRWHDAYKQADASQRLVMDISLDLAYRLERSSRFRDGYVLSEMQVTVFRIFGRIMKGPHALQTLVTCAQLLIEHGWRYADRLDSVFYGIHEFHHKRRHLRTA